MRRLIGNGSLIIRMSFELKAACDAGVFALPQAELGLERIPEHLNVQTCILGAFITKADKKGLLTAASVLVGNWSCWS